MQADWATVGRGRDKLSVFIATLGWARATYVEFCDDERVETLIGCHEGAFLAFCGVPRLCQSYRAQTKGKVERFIGYLIGSFGRAA